MSKVYLFIKQRNVWYETTLPPASPTSCIPTPATHVVMRTESSNCGNSVPVGDPEVHAVAEEIHCMSASSNLNLIFLEKEI